ncbi:MAG TPA: YHS domain-containing protein [Tepidisphaeraceae bacterium]|jgi:YHS domain-containing protein|nr:YHS domain-containing protein [Tepidisphaeraceae bacterium]
MKMMIPAFAMTLLLSVTALTFAEDKPATQPAAAPVNKFCPIQTENPVDPDVTTDWNGKKVAFCCAGCIDEFKKDPEKYAEKMK